ncbi:hypothetical protein ACOSP7_010705 [Xanthoceras sorbifolium]
MTKLSKYRSQFRWRVDPRKSDVRAPDTIANEGRRFNVKTEREKQTEGPEAELRVVFGTCVGVGGGQSWKMGISFG